ncbi:nucleotidyltransferase domain-containing protein [Nostocoides jenkinsii]|uniref:Predicted nucleotidyltransferase n=1 Tax=Nostocoides jenkinsii Ben 74 TaxID=1193518 RepID=A0A077MGK3_9MICO|nr:nucleotidyltransferase domain-containing protein [Tetrasphaera jenkinsii]CCI54888.1 Predicted nucleotidyltransferase [Tetrasphaera jenkinsii Ben 74]
MTDEPNVDLGDREVAPRNEILRTEVGSGVHGMAIPGTDDHDETGVYIEEPAQLLGLADAPQHWIWRTQPMGARSGPGDVDLTVYALRKFVRLVLSGNPTVLIPLYAVGPALLHITPLGQELRELTPALVSREAGHRFLGYLDGQRRRLVGEGPRRSRVPNRPELVDRHGYDTKYASHALRLGLQGLELVTTGRLTLPMRPDDLAPCLAVKRGEVSFTEALALIDRARTDLQTAMDTGLSVLPDVPDRAAVDAWLISAHRRHWAENGL